jgi:GDP/UDP-N,N'-diacetylbacillosamine 2-epimerase (hydrolysing)
MKKRKILYISGTRAEYGLMRETLFAIKKHPSLNIEIGVTGMHLMPEFGRTINEIKRDGFKVHTIKAIFKEDNKESAVGFIGQFILELLKEVKKIRPDIIFVQGDRLETLGGAIVGAYLRIPVAHTHGGDVTSIADEITRHAVTKLAHIHFPATKKSSERIIKMGEDVWRVNIVGAPGLDSILNEKLFSKEEISQKYQLDLSKLILLVIQHPVISEIKESARQMQEIMEAVKELGFQAIVIYPNADPGGREMIKIIEQYRKYLFIKIYKNIIHKDYLSLMKIASVMIGNSSSGIIETPSFFLPAVNIGDRQEGRERSNNIIDVGYDKNQIKKAVNKAIFDKNFKNKIKKSKNPFGDGRAGKRIAEILAKIKIDKKLLNKKITY